MRIINGAQLRIFDLALENWGINSQSTVVCEELFELGVEISKIPTLKRNLEIEVDRTKVIDEMADGFIMINQLAHNYGFMDHIDLAVLNPDQFLHPLDASCLTFKRSLSTLIFDTTVIIDNQNCGEPIDCLKFTPLVYEHAAQVIAHIIQLSTEWGILSEVENRVDFKIAKLAKLLKVEV